MIIFPQACLWFSVGNQKCSLRDAKHVHLDLSDSRSTNRSPCVAAPEFVWDWTKATSSKWSWCSCFVQCCVQTVSYDSNQGGKCTWVRFRGAKSSGCENSFCLLYLRVSDLWELFRFNHTKCKRKLLQRHKLYNAGLEMFDLHLVPWLSPGPQVGCRQWHLFSFGSWTRGSCRQKESRNEDVFQQLLSQKCVCLWNFGRFGHCDQPCHL